MKPGIFIFVCLFFSVNIIAQNVGVGTNLPTNSLHIKPMQTGDSPLRIEGLNAYNVGDSSILMINTATGIVKYVNTSDFISILYNEGTLSEDSQNIDSLILTGTNLTTYIESGNPASVDLSFLIDSSFSYLIANTDTFFVNQNFTDSLVTVLYENADTLLYNSMFINDLRDSIDTNVDSVVLSGTILTIYEDGNGVFVDLSSIADNDPDPQNELQTISESNGVISLSDSGGSVDVGAIINSKVLVASGQNVPGPNANTNEAVIDLSTYGFDASGPPPHIIVTQRNYNYNSVNGNTMDASFCGFTKVSNLVFQTQCWVSTNSSSGTFRSSFDWIAIQILP